MPLDAFHPAVAAWFRSTFPAPTEAQRQAWPAILRGSHTLVAAPTGSGKTLTAFMCAIDALVRQGISAGLQDETTVIYVSPLKALSNDIRVNLEAPLTGIRAELLRMGLPPIEIRIAVRTGDTPQAERNRARKHPPHILVTTPESLYVLLGSDSGRTMLSTRRTMIIDEIHAVADSKRGSHLALSLERLQALSELQLTRIGISATQKPIIEVARLLVGASNVAADGTPNCVIVDIGYTKVRDLALEVPPTPLSATMSNDQWEQIYSRLAELAQTHNTTLVFVNTRRMAERAARHLADRLGKDAVAAHHGSLATALRLDAERRLKHGELRLLVATASLELGIDIGNIDLVCQLGSPRSIAAFLQRAGRSGHAVGGLPKARLFPQSRDDLAECTALLDCVRRGELDVLHIVQAPLDVLAQQIVAEVACAEWDEDELFVCMCRAWPYAQLKRADYDAVVRTLAAGYSTRHGPRAGLVHRDAVHRKLRGRSGARTTALMSGGTIPDTADYAVVLEPQALTIGSVNEDFTAESSAGDIFQLGNASYRILRIEPGRMRVEDAQGVAPNIPFWLGEAPGRSDELSYGVSRLRETISERLRDGEQAAITWLTQTLEISLAAAQQLVDYLARAECMLGAMPSQQRIVLERFFDESGGTQLVVHSPFGSRINRSWGLALRKRFCRKFNLELQTAATEDAIVLSMSASHSFPLIEVAGYLHSSSAMNVLTQALLDAPMFGVRWRWNAGVSLALPRFIGGKKVAAQLQRMKSEDLLATVFPDQVACAENLVGEREVPDHPLVAQTLHDCLHEAMDANAWLGVLQRIEAGTIEVLARDLAAPSPFATEALNAKPYAFLDDAPLEERRTQAVQSRRYDESGSGDDLGSLDIGAIESVREQAWPQPRNADEMHEALMAIGWIGSDEARRHADWPAWLETLTQDHRATRLSVERIPAAGHRNGALSGPGTRRGVNEAGRLEDTGISAEGETALWVCAERLPQLIAVHPEASCQPPIIVPEEFAEPCWTAEAALVELVRSRLNCMGPVTLTALAASLTAAAVDVEIALLHLQTEGCVMQGRYTPGASATEWCERHLLARIHRYTIKRLRRDIEPVEPRDFMRFLCDWQRVSRATRVSGPEALEGILAQMEGFEAPAAAWESELLPARLSDYSMGWLDDQCTAGRTSWTRLRASALQADHTHGPISLRSTPIVLLPRRHARLWAQLAAGNEAATVSLRAQRVLDHLARDGASFFDELTVGAHLLRCELEDALSELIACGRIHCDSFAGLRALMVPASKRPSARGQRRRRVAWFGIEDAGRWALISAATDKEPSAAETALAASPAGGQTDNAATRRKLQDKIRLGAERTRTPDPEAVEHVARTLLQRYGVVCWRLLGREAAWLPAWRELVRVFQRMEARGELRGGRFIAGLSGEQFALPEAIGLLRQVRQRDHDGELIRISASDPLNLAGTLLAGSKVPRLSGARLVYRDGVLVAAWFAGSVEFHASLSAEDQRDIGKLLLREPTPSAGKPVLSDG